MSARTNEARKLAEKYLGVNDQGIRDTALAVILLADQLDYLEKYFPNNKPAQEVTEERIQQEIKDKRPIREEVLGSQPNLIVRPGKVSDE